MEQAIQNPETVHQETVLEHAEAVLDFCRAHEIEPREVTVGTHRTEIQVDEATFRRLFAGADVTKEMSTHFNIWDAELDGFKVRWWQRRADAPNDGKKTVRI